MPATQSIAAPVQGKFGSLELARGLAALLVVLNHAGFMVAEDRYFGRQAFGGLLLNFHVGVDFFFVLSGFIISTVHWDDAGRSARLRHYLKRRFMRIFPPYWVVLTFVAATYSLAPQLGVARQHEWPNLVASYLLFPMPDAPVLGVAWTLVFEVAFYALFAGYILAGRRLLWIFLPWVASILWAATQAPLDYPFAFLTSPYHLEFGLGVFVAYAARERFASSVALLVGLTALGIAIFFVCMVTTGPGSSLELPLVGRFAFGGAAAAIVFGAARLEAMGRIRIPPALQLLGAISYSVYLTHTVTESLSMRFAMRLPAAMRTPDVAALAVSVVGLAGGWAFWRLVEQPLLMRFHRRRPAIVSAPT